ncbi:class I SAM-dependent methyltransferase [Gloeocapsopsis dulcis]|uniref:Class I SAM-dependent methyltransferase n=1 Tax=Gloeocapsopsis dulcis AAB1 = 1H9 TaxID=1433147 RepID=A0A6N8FSB6_9CHRO|nr:class I SAM-dependent methyltransferase [Gloeocapsopsis dulcis]MUL35452.1 hypothetical protein [Gloeocapsopsis dulcis AAB1 = 1H9]WNN90350.1 class I SAM-dependent methyltransferase [Gloeocapsopsis dulcis]
MIQLLIRLSPPRYRKTIRTFWLQYLFDRTVKEIAQLPVGQIPTRKMLENLQLGWGNDGFVANLDYLEEVAKQAAQTSDPILECGSGLTTIILGLLAGRHGVEVYSLEHLPSWRSHVLNVLQKYRIPGVNVCLSPLRDYGDFFWYDPPLSILPQQFQLIICDGPPGKTPGGRYGLLPVMKQYISNGNTILLDDANRPGEIETLDKWIKEAKVKVKKQEMSQGTYALVTY